MDEVEAVADILQDALSTIMSTTGNINILNTPRSTELTSNCDCSTVTGQTLVLILYHQV